MHVGDRFITALAWCLVHRLGSPALHSSPECGKKRRIRPPRRLERRLPLLCAGFGRKSKSDKAVEAAHVTQVSIYQVRQVRVLAQKG